MNQRLWFFILLGLLLVNSGCQSANPVAVNSTHAASSADKACRQTIREFYSLETYCPDNSAALQNLFTKEFNEQYKPTLERCDEISKYEVLALLSENDPGFFNNPDDPKLPGTTEYLAKITFTWKLEGRPDSDEPGFVWLHMQTNDSGDCKIDNTHGGG